MQPILLFGSLNLKSKEYLISSWHWKGKVKQDGSQICPNRRTELNSCHPFPKARILRSPARDPSWIILLWWWHDEFTWKGGLVYINYISKAQRTTRIEFTQTKNQHPVGSWPSPPLTFSVSYNKSWKDKLSCEVVNYFWWLHSSFFKSFIPFWIIWNENMNRSRYFCLVPTNSWVHYKGKLCLNASNKTSKPCSVNLVNQGLE